MLPERSASARALVLSEIVNTERMYCKQLQECLDGMVPVVLQRFPRVSVLAEGFERLRAICCAHQALLPDLEQAYGNDAVAQLMRRLAGMICELYAPYIVGYHDMVAEWTRRRPRHIVEFDGKPPLENYLVLPVGRVPRYKLLCSEMERRTPHDHPEHDVGLGNLFEKECKRVNRSLQAAQACEIVKTLKNTVDVTQFRRLLGHWPATVDGREQVILLFDEFVVLAERTTKLRFLKQTHTVRVCEPLHRVKVDIGSGHAFIRKGSNENDLLEIVHIEVATRAAKMKRKLASRLARTSIFFLLTCRKSCKIGVGILSKDVALLIAKLLWNRRFLDQEVWLNIAMP